MNLTCYICMYCLGQEGVGCSEHCHAVLCEALYYVWRLTAGRLHYMYGIHVYDHCTCMFSAHVHVTDPCLYKVEWVLLVISN